MSENRDLYPSQISTGKHSFDQNMLDNPELYPSSEIFRQIFLKDLSLIVDGLAKNPSKIKPDRVENGSPQYFKLQEFEEVLNKISSSEQQKNRM